MFRIFRTLFVLAIIPILLALLFFGLPAEGAEDDTAAPAKPAPAKPAAKPVGGVEPPARLEWAREAVEAALPDAERVEEFPDDRDWLNVSRPLTLRKDLQGKVVVLDFWCYCCINCIHVLPDLEYLEEKYADQAFAVVGVHSAKFENERDLENIREAVRRYEIKHPVINDFDFRVWKTFGARAWPTFAIITPEGTLLGGMSGEGHRERLDALVYALLERYEKQGGLNTTPLPMRLEQAARAPQELAYPGKLLADQASKRLYVSDSNHNRILELTLEGKFLRAFGDGQRGFVDGAPTKARFFRPQGLALRDGGLYVADTNNHAIRRIDIASGATTTIAGIGTQGRHRSGAHPATTTALASPWDLEWIKGQLYIAMAGTHQLWVYDPEHTEVERFAGDGSEQRLDASDLSRAAFAQPSGFAWDGKWLYVADSESSSIVQVGLAGPVRTLAGAEPSNPRNLFHFGDEDGRGEGRRFQHALGVEFADGVLYVADSYNHKLKRVDRETRKVSSWLGGVQGFGDEPAQFSEPGGLSAAGGKLYVADTNNHAIRVVDLATDAVTTLKLQGVPIPQAATATGGVVGEWPQLPGTEQGFAGTVTLKAGAATNLAVELTLAEGWKLTPNAPSAAALEGQALGDTAVRASIGTTNTLLVLPALSTGEHKLTLRLIYYVCQDNGTCRIRSADLALTIKATADGPTQATVNDVFVP